MLGSYRILAILLGFAPHVRGWIGDKEVVEAAVALALVVCAVSSVRSFVITLELRKELHKLHIELAEMQFSELLARAAAKEMANELLKIGGVPLEEWRIWLN